MGFLTRNGAFFVSPHEPRVTNHVRRKYGGKPSLDPFFSHMAELSPAKVYGAWFSKSMNARHVRKGSKPAVITYGSSRQLCPRYRT
jgi:hypothetical protein